MKKLIICFIALIFPFSIFANSMIQFKTKICFDKTEIKRTYNQDKTQFYIWDNKLWVMPEHGAFEYLYDFAKEERFISPVIGYGLGVTNIGVSFYDIAGMSVDIFRGANSLLQFVVTGELGFGWSPFTQFGFFLSENADFVISKSNKQGIYGALGISCSQAAYESFTPVILLWELNTYIGFRF